MVSQFQLQKSCLLLLVCVAVGWEGSLAWVAPKPAASTKSSSGSKTNSNSIPMPSKTAKYYTTHASILAEDAAKAAATALASPKPSPQSPQSPSLAEARQLPWRNEPDSPDADPSQNCFLDLWEWQLEYFQDHLTNLKVRDAVEDSGIRELYYATKDSNQRCYTISLESEEYRDIRMTYMHCPGMQTFRCLSYPRNGDLPILAMTILKMGNSKNLGILDYQPLPPQSEAQETINETFIQELLKVREDMPSFAQAMTHRHFDSNEERKYFTESPLLGRCNELEASDAEKEEYRTDLLRAQQRHVSKHIQLTKSMAGSPQARSVEYALERHADFDTHVCDLEPSGPFLNGVFGPEMGEKIQHNVIFPLSRHASSSSSS